MVGRISPQTPEPGSHQHCSETLRTAHYSLPALFAARTKHFPRHLHHVAPISLPFSAASAYFLSRRGCTSLCGNFVALASFGDFHDPFAFQGSCSPVRFGFPPPWYFQRELSRHMRVRVN